MVSEMLQSVEWSRAQFALTAIYHWLFVPLTLGLSVLCALMETRYYRTGDPFWRSTTKFWMRLFGINFAIGVATGLILEFEFGTNWSNYSNFVGDIFGAPLAIEGIMAFFLESTFVAVMFFGWDKVSRGFHLSATWLTAIGANLSALWILVANSWMQYPVGCSFNIATVRNEMDSFWDVLFSPVAINKFSHTVTSSFLLAAIFVMGVSAWYLLRGRHRRMARSSIALASVFGLVFALVAAFSGDRSGAIVARVQPMKLAAMEALYDGEEGAPLTVVGLLRPEGQRTCDDDAFYFKIGIPKLLSLMSFRSADAFVPGINDLVYGNEERGILSTAEKMSRVHTSVKFAIICGIAMLVAGMFVARPILEAIDTPVKVLDQAVLYLRIYFVGMPFIILYNFGAAVLRAIGDTRRPLYCLIVSGVLNVILNLFFVCVCKLGSTLNTLCCAVLCCAVLCC